jgi:hypothetical protein
VGLRPPPAAFTGQDGGEWLSQTRSLGDPGVGQLLHEGRMLWCGTTQIDHSAELLPVSFQQGLRVEPKTGKNSDKIRSIASG